jgi:hypothetical protein
MNLSGSVIPGRAVLGGYRHYDYRDAEQGADYQSTQLNQRNLRG